MTVKTVLQRGVFFEISYGRALCDARARRELFANGQVAFSSLLFSSLLFPFINNVKSSRSNEIVALIFLVNNFPSKDMLSCLLSNSEVSQVDIPDSFFRKA